MIVGQITCPNCRLPLPGNFWNTPESMSCPACDRKVHVDVFPALFRRTPVGKTAESIVEAGISSCFYHESKKAVISCDGCGRFLCALCDVELNGRHFCPSCLNLSRTQGRHVNLESSRIVYERAAVSLALWPIIIWPATLLTAPAAVVCGFLSFFRPGSLVGRRPARAIIAIVLGMAEMAGWGLLFYTAAK